MGWEVRGRLRWEGAYVYLWLIDVAVWQKPTQYCKAISLHLNINKFFKRGGGSLFSSYQKPGTVLNKFTSVQSLSHVQLFVTPWTAAPQGSLSIISSRSLLKLMFIESVMPSNHLNAVVPFSCPQSFPASGSFQMSQFSSGDQSIGVSASASVLPMNIQD